MSSNSTPGHTTTSYDSHYDPSFSAEISSKMHVPTKICVIEKSGGSDFFNLASEEVKTNMNVPERILVAGDNKHIAMRETLLEMKYDTPLPHEQANYILPPPPDSLTVNEYPYPEEPRAVKTDVKRSSNMDQSMNGMNDLNDTMNTTYYGGNEDEIAMLRRQVRHLSRRVLTVEQDNYQRQQRETVIFVIGIGYFFIKGMMWLQRKF